MYVVEGGTFIDLRGGSGATGDLLDELLGRRLL